MVLQVRTEVADVEYEVVEAMLEDLLLLLVRERVTEGMRAYVMVVE